MACTTTPDADWDLVTVAAVALTSSVRQSMSATLTNAFLSSSKVSSQRVASRIENGTVTLVSRLASGWVRVGLVAVLGVSDGLSSGYGATTFPALTESITLEKNATQAQYEVERLEALVDGIIKFIGH